MREKGNIKAVCMPCHVSKTERGVAVKKKKSDAVLME
jgi:hypothetical protein